MPAYGSFEVIVDGLITEPYATKYGFEEIEDQNTYRFIDEEKIGLIVRLIVEGKPTLTFYHEVENFDPETGEKHEGFPDNDTKNYHLQKLADNYANS